MKKILAITILLSIYMLGNAQDGMVLCVSDGKPLVIKSDDGYLILLDREPYSDDKSYIVLSQIEKDNFIEILQHIAKVNTSIKIDNISNINGFSINERLTITPKSYLFVKNKIIGKIELIQVEYKEKENTNYSVPKLYISLQPKGGYSNTLTLSTSKMELITKALSL